MKKLEQSPLLRLWSPEGIGNGRGFLLGKPSSASSRLEQLRNRLPICPLTVMPLKKLVVGQCPSAHLFDTVGDLLNAIRKSRGHSLQKDRFHAAWQPQKKIGGMLGPYGSCALEDVRYRILIEARNDRGNRHGGRDTCI